MKNFMGLCTKPIVAYVLIVIVVVIGFFRLETLISEGRQNRIDQVEAICQQAAINRAGLRIVVEDIADTNIDAVRSIPGAEGSEAVEILVARFEQFRDTRLNSLPPTPDCTGQSYAEIEEDIRQGNRPNAPQVPD